MVTAATIDDDDDDVVEIRGYTLGDTAARGGRGKWQGGRFLASIAIIRLRRTAARDVS